MTDLMRSIRQMRATKLSSSGREHISEKEWKTALEDLKEAQSFYEELGDSTQVSIMLSLQGLCQFALGLLDEAACSMRTTVVMKNELGQMEGMATDLLGLGEVLFKMGDGAGSLAAFKEAKDIFDRLDLIEAKESALNGIDRASLLMSRQ